MSVVAHLLLSSNATGARLRTHHHSAVRSTCAADREGVSDGAVFVALLASEASE
jgi:hypothetical protein